MTGQKIQSQTAGVTSFILATGGLVCLLVFSYFLYYYAWTAQRHLTGWGGVAVYYVAPATLGVLLLSAARFRPSIRLNLTLALLSIGFCVYLTEGALEISKSFLAKPRQKPGFTKLQAEELSKKFGVAIDMRDGLEVVGDLRKQGVNAVPAVLPEADLLINNKQPDGSLKSFISVHGSELLPLGGIAQTSTVTCNEGGPWITYKTDQHGFNNPPDVWDGGFDVAAIGDSHAGGYCVPQDKSFVALVRQHGARVVNLGMGGNGPLIELASLKEYVEPFRPKTVLWFYSEGTDLVDLQLEKKSKLLMQYLQDGFSQNLLQRQSEIDHAIGEEIPKQIELHRTDWSNGSVAHFLHGMKDAEVPAKPPNRPRRPIFDVATGFVKLSALRERLGMVYGTDTADVERLKDLEGPNMDLFREVLSRVQARAHSWGSRLYFVYVPSWKHCLPDDHTPDFGADFGIKQRPRILTMVDDLGIPLIDIEPVCKTHKDPASLLPFRKPGHFNEEGHRLIAETVIKAVSDLENPAAHSAQTQNSN